MCVASECGCGQIEPDLAECEGAGLDRADAGDDIGKALFSIVADEHLPVGPITIFEDTSGKPCGVLFKVKVFGPDIPEQMWRELRHRMGAKEEYVECPRPEVERSKLDERRKLRGDVLNVEF